ncbi:hypothetical protein E3P89_02581 [Wallemia ichthyophaga]|uniref:General transcription and DNA repair factor IIH subunit TFB4 n=2 Tax=Wallemia ichthyophaga TaxID=245174 RepID=A0A4T0GUC5_WALIC|nr:General transcription factor IIH subunit 3 [Wallemia ichthyophaga EXF-994]TIA89597.1 hypothetical protein E3P97_02954 [Wallemia ichthyophaga]EOR00885.1 General transcription factor IIH subunit 3 [Wallemia ichthyophaga EXF-994]TIB03846.1 hypothetical protein E3P95_00389 [Wallemia ichthyophaga]TIB04995.1 hypothetical protein E3P94_00389 [Wallemia ichthyophaga]TIB05262.1 hypothetical protein E3P96_01260 [Wallemia ichthyophaga]
MATTSNHLSVVLELKNKNVSLSSLKQLLVFINLHLSNSDLNSASVHLNNKILFDTHEDDANFSQLSEVFVECVRDFYRTDKPVKATLATTLAQSLCHINRKLNEASASSDSPHSFRILVITTSDDVPSHYVSLMNSIFAAQKAKILVDVCELYNSNTIFLQQAAHLTGGNYIQVKYIDSLIQYLIMAFLPNHALRHKLVQPRSDKVDFRAACFCHKRIVDMAYICSVCLSIFCHPPQRCSTCDSPFPVHTLTKFGAHGM